MVEFRRGFKSWCEKVSLGFRRDLSVSPSDALCPRSLANHLSVEIWTPHEVANAGGLDPKFLNYLLKKDQESWSAVTLVVPQVKIIIPNTAHSPARQNSDLMHELAHHVLDHRPAIVNTTAQGLMFLDDYDKLQEDEADWLGGALLIPRAALLEKSSELKQQARIADHFGTSQEMVRWRIQTTGVGVQLSRRASFS
jgi:Zn-dependent peptidase ImmA (M78 family)